MKDNNKHWKEWNEEYIFTFYACIIPNDAGNHIWNYIFLLNATLDVGVNSWDERPAVLWTTYIKLYELFILTEK